MPESTAMTKSMHVPAHVHRALRRRQLEIEEQTEETVGLGDLASAAILLGLQRPLEDIVAVVKQQEQQDARANTEQRE